MLIPIKILRTITVDEVLHDSLKKLIGTHTRTLTPKDFASVGVYMSPDWDHSDTEK